MTVRELISELEALPGDKIVVFRHTRDDAPDDYETVDCWWVGDEAFIDIHSADEDPEEVDGATEPIHP